MEYVKCNEKAFQKSKKKYPNDLTKFGPYADKLTMKCEREIREKYGLSNDQEFQIFEEGRKKGWPMPDIYDF